MPKGRQWDATESYKLNTRFLSAGDYLLRNFRLFVLESMCKMRGDIVDVVRRMRPALKSNEYISRGGDAGQGGPIPPWPHWIGSKMIWRMSGRG